MTDGAYQQHRICADAPGGDTSVFDCTGEAVVSIDWVEKDGKFRIETVITKHNKHAIKFTHAPDGRQFFAICRDTKIRFILAANKDWRFSNQFDALTTKNDLPQFYGKLEYHKQNAIYFPKGSSGKKSIAGHREITILAKHHEMGRVNTTHGFSFNIDLLQVGKIYGFELKPTPLPLWLSITVDPDIKNPPGDDDFNPGGLVTETFSSAI